MKVGIACDHAGYDLKSAIIKSFQGSAYNFIDCGTNNKDPVDYPDIAQNLCQKLIKKDFNIAVLICGSGIGISIAANRFKEIRAALCHNQETAILARQHNDANILCLGSRTVNEETAIIMIKSFLETKFSGDRHKIRVEKLSKI